MAGSANPLLVVGRSTTLANPEVIDFGQSVILATVRGTKLGQPRNRAAVEWKPPTRHTRIVILTQGENDQRAEWVSLNRVHTY